MAVFLTEYLMELLQVAEGQASRVARLTKSQVADPFLYDVTERAYINNRLGFFNCLIHVMKYVRGWTH